MLIEACLRAGWVRALCGDKGARCLVANTSSEAWKAKHLKRKTDRDDARRLIEICRFGEFPTVHVPPKEVRELRALIEHDVAGTVNICSSIEVTVREVIETVAELLGHPEKVRLGAGASRGWNPPYICGDNTKLVREGRWSPRYDLRAGLADLIHRFAPDSSVREPMSCVKR